mmetsp:Transcript_1863/g.1659  ORF Transcript_1863/g.1659 Transcript_1863/m.1659 type:complete len:126 (+) Transcript_1863:3-380(+)
MNNSVNIWNDSLCEVESEYSSSSESQTLNQTRKFRNSLRSNKGTASTAREFRRSNSHTQTPKFLVESTNFNIGSNEDHQIKNHCNLSMNFERKDSIKSLPISLKKDNTLPGKSRFKPKTSCWKNL